METQEDKNCYKRIMFENCDTEAEVNNLKDIDQKEGLAKYLSQKVAFEAVICSLVRSTNLPFPKRRLLLPKTTTTLLAFWHIVAAVSTQSNPTVIQTISKCFWSDNQNVQAEMLCCLQVLEE